MFKYISMALSLVVFSCLSVANEMMVDQILEPTGGSVKKPKDWFYAERHRAANSLFWIVSKENPENGYETGLAIQFMMGIKDGTGLSPEELVRSNISQIVKNSNVVRRCEESIIGNFTKMCLEINQFQERDGTPVEFTILYSFLWDNKRDSVGITVAGSPKSEWEKYSKVFDQMTEIKLIDFDRFK